MVKFGIGNLSFKHHRQQIITALLVALGCFGQGQVSGWNSSALPSLAQDKHFRNLTIAETSWIASLVPFGSLISTPLAGISIDRFGRKRTILVAESIQLLGWLSIISATHVSMLYLGRLATGISVGALGMVVPVYISEIADPEVRGSLSIITHFMNSTGQLLSYVAGAVSNWQFLAFLSAFPSVILLALSGLIPDSPRFLLSIGKKDEAMRVTQWLKATKPHAEVNEEIESMLRNMEDSKKEKTNLSTQLLKRHILIPLLSCCILMILQQLSGSGALQAFMVNIFQSAGAAIDPYLCQIVVGFLAVCANSALTLVIDHANRRELLILSGTITAISHFVLAIFFAAKSSGDVPTVLGLIPIFCLLTYFVAFNIGFGPLPNLLMSELLPRNIIGIASGITVFCHYLTSFWVTFSFQALDDIFGPFWVFLFFAIFCGLGALFVYYAIPETKMKTFEEIQSFYGRTKPAQGIIYE